MAPGTPSGEIRLALLANRAVASQIVPMNHGASCRATVRTGDGRGRPAANLWVGAGALAAALEAGPPCARHLAANGGERT